MPAADRLLDVNAALIVAGAISVLAIPVAFGAATKGPVMEPGATEQPPKVAPASVVSPLGVPTVKTNVVASLALLATTDINVAFLR